MLPISSDRDWTLKPCLNCNPSSELDELIRTVAGMELTFKSQLKPLICKHSDGNEADVNDL